MTPGRRRLLPFAAAGLAAVAAVSSARGVVAQTLGSPAATPGVGTGSPSTGNPSTGSPINPSSGATTRVTPGAARGPRRGDDPPLPAIDDLRRLVAQVRSERRPLLLFFTTPGCPYCRAVRRGYLAPRLAEPDGGGVIIREVSLLKSTAYPGLDGRPMTDRELAARFGVNAVPVVQLVDDALRPLADPLVGLNADFYETYLQRAIDQALAALAAR